ncbi:uncharacterized protein BP5553_06872 [Venustampulla echinocandica]|uniref:Protein kinase domain-containing protein n=1 Tax=Venustampulla echinocandica TaxID=2656787 RepID=A0A370TL48_9HELO|nr:uncharacterized protein BP5553_06872 [Venustampulla echinocandica]RDL36260.1 hypothetical protein BP5553_06872 [Venustampulla echinocandica]
MATESHRKTRFPAPGRAGSRLTDQEDPNAKRQTLFPGGMRIRTLSLLESNKSPVKSNIEGNALQILSRSVKVNPPNAVPTRPPPEMKIKNRRPYHPSGLHTLTPWDTYKALRPLQRGGEVTAACARTDPSRMVTIKKLSLSQFQEFRSCQHENLLVIIDGYRAEDQIFVVTDYTVSTLKYIIAIALPLEELHVFEGMQYLSEFGITRNKLDSSSVLFLSDGCVKLGVLDEIALLHRLKNIQAYFDECESADPASARSLGVIAMEMMQNNIPPATEKLVLNNPDQWSAEASDFLDIASWATLKEIQKVRDLYFA